MSHRFVIVALITVALVLTAPPVSRAQGEPQQVVVTNFPNVQNVTGTVAVDGVIRHGILQQVKDVLVPPVRRERTTRLVDGGELVTDGFTAIVLTLNGRIRGTPLEAGTVGAILIPDEESVLYAFDEEGQFHFPLEIAAAVPAADQRSFASDQRTVPVAFPRYRIRFYNTSDRTVTVNLFAYLTN